LSDYIIDEDGIIYNPSSKRYVKPYNDKRRPDECPCVYLQIKTDGNKSKRTFMYHDELMALTFFEKYEPGMYVHHLDGDITNCKLSNLSIDNGVKALTNIHKETKEWCKIDIGLKLYYDYYICEDGRLYNSTTDSFIKPFKDPRNKDYLRYNLYVTKKMDDVIHVAVSRLVAYHFIPKPEGKDIVIFRDGDPTNCDKENLYWGDNWDIHNKVHQQEREWTKLYDELLGEEKWKKLKLEDIDLEDEYYVSNFGRVWNDSKGFYPNIHNNSEKNRCNQYHKAIILNTEYGFKDFLVHRLVAIMFVKNKHPKIYKCVNHINGNPECNYAINLEWCDPYQNLHHAIETNLKFTNKFNDRVESEGWRLNTILAWIYSIPGVTDELAYKFYSNYTEKYDDNIPILSFDEFINQLNDRRRNNEDFIKISKFYGENYSSAVD
jgi:hypothetical protein